LFDDVLLNVVEIILIVKPTVACQNILAQANYQYRLGQIRLTTNYKVVGWGLDDIG
jgi:hypothetical protein